MSKSHPSPLHALSPPAHVYGFEEMAVEGFSYGGLFADGSAVSVVLGDSTGVTGRIETVPSGLRFHARTAEYLTLESLDIVGAGDTRRTVATGPVRLETVDVALDSAHHPYLWGVVRVGTLEAKGLTVDLTSATEEAPTVVRLGAIRARGIVADFKQEATVIFFDELSFERLDGNFVADGLDVERVRIEGLSITLPRDGEPSVAIDAASLDRIVTAAGTMKGVVVQSLEAAARWVVAERLDAEHVSHHIGRGAEDEPASTTTTSASVETAGRWAFLDHLHGHLEADLTTIVDVPVLPSWRAHHELRLTIDEGRIEYKKLERGMGKLPDAVLDFNLDDDRLCFDKDIPLVPFDRQTLVSWPLDEAGQEEASRGWVKLSTLAEPDVHVTSKPKQRDEGARFLRAVVLERLALNVSVTAGAAIPLPEGGQVVLAVTSPPRGHAIRDVAVSAHATYRPGPASEPGEVEARLEGVAIRAVAIPVGAWTFDAGAIHAGAVTSVFTLDELTMAGGCLAADALRLEGLSLRRPAPSVSPSGDA
ncbi:MAG: hypothetical protein AAGN82_27105 [Myxococcota bacterium]